MHKRTHFVVLMSSGLCALAQPVMATQGASPEAPAPGQIILLKRSQVAQPAAAAPSGVAAPQTRQVASAQPATPDAALRLPAPLGARVKSQTLPGLGVMPGDSADMRIKSVRVGSDRNELVYISQTQLNKISTPFESPQIIDSTGAVLRAVGQDLFLQPASDKPLTVYITNGGQGQSIGLTLVPQPNLPAQSIVLQLDTPAGNAAIKAEAEEIVASDYVSRINSLIRSLALDRTPAGFTRSRLPASVVAGKELVIEPQHKYAGTTYDLYSYKVRSISSSPLEMREEAFYTEAVRAVSFFPSALLQPGEETNVFVIEDRPAKDAVK